jgi:hypothetical protein
MWGIRGNGELICAKRGCSDTGNDGNGEANVGKDPVDLGKDPRCGGEKTKLWGKHD